MSECQKCVDRQDWEKRKKMDMGREKQKVKQRNERAER